ncbi:MAG: four helix bundle protein [Bacteroidales bacterium]
MEPNKSFAIQDLSKEFAVDIIELYKFIKTKNEYWLGDQLVRSGTSIGALIKEAQSSESRKDFIHKMKIAAKEANETEYWLTLCAESYDFPKVPSLLGKNRQIIKILSKILFTANQRLKP